METAAESSSESSEQASEKECIAIPIGICSEELGTLEAVTKYLKENRGITLTRIALILNRDPRTIWGAYNSSRQKHPEPFCDAGERTELQIPATNFSNRSLSMLENVAWHLSKNLGMPTCKIAVLVKRDYSTIWTVLHRAKSKRRQAQC